MNARLILNPVAGSDAGAQLLPLINERLRSAFGPLDIVLTTGEGDAIDAARRSVAQGYDLLFVAGGDGTLNEVLNGVASVPAGLERTVFGVIPLGTGNDFATALGIPADIEKALDALLVATPGPVDVGVLNGRHFINVSGGGFIAEVSDAVDESLKTIAGKLAYLIGGAQVLLRHEPIAARIETPTPVEGQRPPAALEIHAFAVCNAPLIGGGRLIAPAAMADDGLLDVCVIESMPVVEFVALLTRV